MNGLDSLFILHYFTTDSFVPFQMNRLSFLARDPAITVWQSICKASLIRYYIILYVYGALSFFYVIPVSSFVSGFI